MGQITSLFVHRVARQASPSVDTRPLVQEVGVDPDSPVDPALMVPAAKYYEFLEKLARLDPAGHSLPLRAGATMRSDDYAAFGLAWKSAPTLRASYSRAERYARVLTSVATYGVEPAEQGAYMHLHRAGERRLGMRISNEATIASIMAISGEVSTRPFQPLEVHLKHRAPSTTEAHEQHFGCPVHFGSDRDALLVSSETLDAANKLGDAGISRFFESHLEVQVEKLDRAQGLARDVKVRVSDALSEGVPTLSEVARQLGMSARSLQRRLQDTGYSFQEVVDAARRELSERLLEGTGYSIADVAFLTGFADQASFTRAFKRWAGQTPRSYRLSGK
jgi:AraC-like DNA-binding protein